jgi:hypothetical protein
MQSNPFTELYKNYTNQKLAEIVSHPNDYQKDAVTAAQSELDSRNSSAAEISILITDNLSSKPKGHPIANYLQTIKTKLFVFPNENIAITYLINSVSVLLLIEYILIYRDLISYIYYDIKHEITPDFKYVSYLLFVFTRLVFIWLFWRRNIVGWVWIVAWAIYCLLNTFISFYYAFVEPTDTEKIRILYPENTGENYLFWLVFCGGILYILYLKPVTGLYKVSNLLAILTGILAVLYVCQQLYI